MKDKSSNEGYLEKLSSKVSYAAGTSAAFIIALLVIVSWLASGPFFHYSDTWQLVINTGTTIVTFLMVFLIQRTQNKESMAVNLKLNELIAANAKASNRLVSVENLTEDELKVLTKFYTNIAALSKKDKSMQQTHSIEEAVELHALKSGKTRASAARASVKPDTAASA